MPKQGNETMDYSSFLNLIGRAGRPFQTDEGQIILLTSAGTSRFDRDKINKFLNASGKDIKNRISPIRFLIESEKNNLTNEKEYRTTLGTLETLLLALIVEGIIVTLRDNEPLTRCLAFGDDDLELYKYIQKTLADIEDRFIDTYKIAIKKSGIIDINEKGLTVYESGFIPWSSVKGIDWICNNPKLISNLYKLKTDVKNPDFEHIWKELITYLLQTDEGQAYLNDDRTYETLEKWISSTLAWMKEYGINEIAFNKYHGDILETLSEIEGDLTSFIAWGLFAMSKWAGNLKSENVNELEKTLFTLSNYVWYGTCDPFSLKLMKRDILKRLMRDDVLTIVKAIKKKKIKNFINKPYWLHDKSVINSIKRLGSLKISGDEVTDNILKIYKIK